MTVLARTEDRQNFAWLAAIKRNDLPAGAEAKSTLVLPIMDARPAVRDVVLSNVSSYAIVIVDLYEFGRRILDGIVERLRPIIPTGDPYTFVLELPTAGSTARDWLRTITISESVLGRLEALMSWAANPFADDAAKEGLAAYFGRRPVPTLVESDALVAMNDQQLASLLARLGSAVGDALSPQRQAGIMLRAIEDQRFFSPGYFASELVRVDVEADKIYDVGPLPVLTQLQFADERIWQFIQSQVQASLVSQVHRGLLDERSSQAELGLQAADIAAAIASREYERAETQRSGTGGHAVKRIFDRVLLNGRWL